MSASICVAIYIQGETRYASSASSWMFHGACRRMSNVPSLSMTTSHFALFRQREIDDGFINYAPFVHRPRREYRELGDRPFDFCRVPPLASFAVVPRKTLNYIFYDRTGRGYEGQGNTLALYFPNLILLSDSFELDQHQETIVRELVRHLQFESGGTFDCPQQDDREAYEMQIRWVEEAGKGSRPGPIFMQRLRCNTPLL